MRQSFCNGKNALQFFFEIQLNTFKVIIYMLFVANCENFNAISQKLKSNWRTQEKYDKIDTI